MTPFEFLVVAISVILGLSITRLVSGLGISVRQIKTKKFFWLHGIWINNILILIPAFWWTLFNWSTKEDWNFLHFLLLIVYTTVLYLITDFLVPEKFDSKLDAKSYFFENRKLFFGILIAALLIDVIETYVLASGGLRELPIGFPHVSIALISLSLVGLFVENLKVQYLTGVSWGAISGIGRFD